MGGEPYQSDFVTQAVSNMQRVGPTAMDGDRLARMITNERGRHFWATGGEQLSGDQAFTNLMARAQRRA